MAKIHNGIVAIYLSVILNSRKILCVAMVGKRQHIFLPLSIYRDFPPVILLAARAFIHNAGLVNEDDRKGTRDSILAFRKVKRKDISLIVRMQKAVPLPELDERIKVQVGNLADPKELYATGEVAIQPSKLEGVGFMVIEPLCSGMPVITLDYPPMNEYVRMPELLVRRNGLKERVFPVIGSNMPICAYPTLVI